MKPISMANTKKEIMNAYEAAMAKIQELEKQRLNPEKKVQEKRREEVTLKADAIMTDNLEKSFETIKSSIVSALSDIYGKMEEQSRQYLLLQEAITLKEQELKDIYEIERNAATLAALIEAQNDKKAVFEQEMAVRKAELTEEIEALKLKIAIEKAAYEKDKKAQIEQDKESQKRQSEEFEYEFARKKRIRKNELDDELAALKRATQEEIERKTREIEERLADITAREGELEELRNAAARFEQTLQDAVTRAREETTERVKIQLQHEIELSKRQFTGEKDVMLTRIEALQSKVEEQAEMIASLSAKLEKSYANVQNVAVKAIEGASQSGFRNLKDAIAEKRDES